jgi:hypothetical protein
MIKPLYGHNKADVCLLDKIQQVKPATLITPCQGKGQADVSGRHTVSGSQVTPLDAICEHPLLVRRQ